MQFVNMTPHPIILRADDGSEVVLPPSGTVARVSSSPGKLLDWTGPVSVHAPTVWGETVDLPAPKDGTAYIVSAIVAARCASRTDVVSPGTGPEDQAIRDSEGRIVAVTRLVAASPAYGRQ